MHVCDCDVRVPFEKKEKRGERPRAKARKAKESPLRLSPGPAWSSYLLWGPGGCPGLGLGVLFLVARGGEQGLSIQRAPRRQGKGSTHDARSRRLPCRPPPPPSSSSSLPLPLLPPLLPLVLPRRRARREDDTHIHLGTHSCSLSHPPTHPLRTHTEGATHTRPLACLAASFSEPGV